ncbi:MAG: replication initiator protein A, partial [Clostridiaceae bacterium]|nr:replication initiator protein A [Clostridiaceae bacterium]
MLYIENKSNDGFLKRLYGFPSSAILLDRMNLSARNGWLDEEGRVYIIFTIEEIKGALVIFRTHFEECLRMLADRADLRSLGSYYDMSAVTALPDGNAALLKHLHG